MEKWKEYRKGEIPKGNYKAKVICGDSNFLIIELRSKENRLILDFGITEAVRIFDRRLVDLDMYENIEGLKEDNFSNVIYEVEDGKYLKEANRYSGGILDIGDAKQYTVITENLYIDVVSFWECRLTLMKKLRKEEYGRKVISMCHTNWQS